MEEVASELSHFHIGWIKVAYTRARLRFRGLRPRKRCPLLPGSPPPYHNLVTNTALRKCYSTECTNAALIKSGAAILTMPLAKLSSPVQCSYVPPQPPHRARNRLHNNRFLLNASLGGWAASPLLLRQR